MGMDPEDLRLVTARERWDRKDTTPKDHLALGLFWDRSPAMDDYTPPTDPLNVLHEDHEIIIVDKPSGLLSVG